MTTVYTDEKERQIAVFEDFKGWLINNSHSEDYKKLIHSAMAINSRRAVDETRIIAKRNTEETISSTSKLLVELSKGNFRDKKNFHYLFNKVVHNLYSLFCFLSIVREERGLGHTIHKAVKKWFASRATKKLEKDFQLYPQGFGWTTKDVLSLFHIKPRNEREDLLFKKAVNK